MLEKGVAVANKTWSALSSFFLIAISVSVEARATRESYAPPPDHPSRIHPALPPAALYDCPDCKRLRGYFITISAGHLRASNEKSETIVLRPDVAKTYTANRNNSGYFTGELFAGYESIVEEGAYGQLGVAVAATRLKVNGDILDDANPKFNDYTYKYDTKRLRVAAKGKLAADLIFAVAGYVSGSAGFAFNQSDNFSSTPRTSFAVPLPPFKSNHEIGFSYTLGAGFETIFLSSWRGGIGYEFADWGPSSLARAPGQSLENGLGMSHLYTHAILLSLTFLG